MHQLDRASVPRLDRITQSHLTFPCYLSCLLVPRFFFFREVLSSVSFLSTRPARKLGCSSGQPWEGGRDHNVPKRPPSCSVCADLLVHRWNGQQRLPEQLLFAQEPSGEYDSRAIG